MCWLCSLRDAVWEAEELPAPGEEPEPAAEEPPPEQGASVSPPG